MSSNVLGARDSNAQMKPASPEKNTEKPKSLEYHRQMLHSRLQDGNKAQQFISPSDSIQSPATQKLSAFRNKHITKKAKPQTLFKRASSKNFESAKGAAMFADIPKTDKDVPTTDESGEKEEQT